MLHLDPSVRRPRSLWGTVTEQKIR